MKKIFYSFLLFAVALVSTAALVSCGGDDEDDDVPKGQNTLSIKFSINEDLYKITDMVVTGITPFNLTTKTTLHSQPALEAQEIVLTGQQADNANFSVSFKLKPNWKEILGDQKEVYCYYQRQIMFGTSNGGFRGDLTPLTEGGKANFNKTDDAKFVEFIEHLGFKYSTK